MTQKIWCAMVDFHENFENRNTSTVIGLYRSKKNAYKQALLYEFEANKKWFRDKYDTIRYEKLINIFDEQFEINEENFIEKWISIREDCLNNSIIGLSSGYRFNIISSEIMD